MKIEFTIEDWHALEDIYFDHERTLPSDYSSLPKTEEYNLLRLLCLRMAERVYRKVSKD